MPGNNRPAMHESQCRLHTQAHTHTHTEGERERLGLCVCVRACDCRECVCVCVCMCACVCLGPQPVYLLAGETNTCPKTTCTTDLQPKVNDGCIVCVCVCLCLCVCVCVIHFAYLPDWRDQYMCRGYRPVMAEGQSWL